MSAGSESSQIELPMIGLREIQQARQVIQQAIHKTPISFSNTLSAKTKTQLYFKHENEQRTGSFKIRGAFNKISSLSVDEKKRGVIAVSAGNHAQGVALSASLAGVKSRIVMPESAALVKVEATREYGAEVILHGDYVDVAMDYGRKLASEQGYVFVHPFEDPKIIAGQGTIALEILEEISDFDTIVVPIGGGGLIAGISLAVKALNPKCRVLGVQAERAPNMANSFKKGSIGTDLRAASTIADGIAVKKPSPYTFQYISEYVDDVATVSEDEIAEAIVVLMERNKTVVEGAGAAGLAAVLADKLKLGQKTCVVLSGGNIDMNIVEKIIGRGLWRHGRLVHISVVVNDVPGMLNKITECLARERANIMEVNHDRVSKGLALLETRIDFLIETASEQHVQKIMKALEAIGIHPQAQ